MMSTPSAVIDSRQSYTWIIGGGVMGAVYRVGHLPPTELVIKQLTLITQTIG